MAINNVGIGASVLGPSVLALKSQLGSLQEQMASGKKASTYAGMGVNEGFAVAARAQLSNISAFADTMTKVTTNINVANTALQSLSDIGNEHGSGGRQYRARAEQQWADHGAADRRRSAGLHGRHSQHPGRRPLPVFRQRHRHPRGGLRRHDAERQWQPGRVEADHFGAPGGRPGDRYRPPGRRPRSAQSLRSPRMPPARPSA